MSDEVIERSTAARAGICALIFRCRASGWYGWRAIALRFSFFALSFGAFLVLLAAYAAIEHLNFGLWIGLALFLLAMFARLPMSARSSLPGGRAG